MSELACILTGGPTYTIVADGHRWTFEDHPYCGPSVIGKRGDVLSNQPVARSQFWRACELWRAQGKRVDAGGLCAWSEPPPERWLQIVGSRMLVSDTPEHRERLAGFFVEVDLPAAPEKREGER